MPVDDLPVHDSVRHKRALSDCWNKPREIPCRQVGMREGTTWVPLPDCVGCSPANSPRDWEYIVKARADIEEEMARFMKADQRIAK